MTLTPVRPAAPQHASSGTHAVGPARRAPWLSPSVVLGTCIAGWPVVWVFGLTQFVFIAVALLLGYDLLRREHIRTPPGFIFWVLFLAVVLLSVTAMEATPPGTITGTGFGRYAAFAIRFLNYASTSVIMLWVGNTSERELPRLRIVLWIALLGVWTILLGFLALAAPHASVPTVMSFVLPSGVTDLLGDGGSRASLAQVQTVLGSSAPRPAAPFDFTNAWGCVLSLALIAMALVALNSRRLWVRLGLGALALASIVPIVYSLNRGMWIGLGLSVVYIAVRLAARGRVLAIGALALAVGIAGIVFIASPLQGLVTSRLDHGQSNGIRSSLGTASLDGALHSPITGYGSTRQTIGSDASITIGKTQDCPRCGNRNIGSTGQFLLLLIAQGFVGTGLYVLYFVRTFWAYRHDASPLGIGASLIVLLTLWYGFFYTALTMPLVIAFLAIALLWRNSLVRSSADA